MPDQVQHAIRKERNADMRAVFEQSAAEYRSRFVGENLSVLWETAAAIDANGWKVSGLTDNYLRVTARTPKRLWNQITPVQLTGVRDGGMVGKIVR